MNARPDWQAEQMRDDESRAESVARLLREAESALGDRGEAWREEITNALWNVPLPEKAMQKTVMPRRPF